MTLEQAIAGREAEELDWHTGDFKPQGKVTKMAVTDSPTETLAQWCRDLAPPKSEQPGPAIALVARHMTPSDSDTCVRNVGGTSETAVGWPCSNALLITDRYANVKRMEAIVKALDVGTPYKPEKCEPTNPGKRSDS